MVRSLLGLLLVALVVADVCGAEADPQTGANQPASGQPKPKADPPVPLNKEGTVLLDKANKKLLLKGELCLREGLLEMLICRKKSKEHESIVAVDAEAFVIHAGLIAVGAEPGKPVSYQPKYTPPTGQTIDIYFNWTDANGQEHRRRAQELVRQTIHRYHVMVVDPFPTDLTLVKDDDLRYDQRTKELIWFGPMQDAERTELLKRSQDKSYQQAIEAFYKAGESIEIKADFVFAGSGFSELKDGTKWYQAEAGNLVCVANFGDAMIDVSIQSSADNEAGLMYEPYTERLPELRTAVTVELIPVPKAKEQPDKSVEEPQPK